MSFKKYFFQFIQVESAVRFLQNPRVQQRSYSDKTSFLKSKGLTNEEIQMACTRSGTGNAGDETKVKKSLKCILLNMTHCGSIMYMIFSRFGYGKL